MKILTFLLVLLSSLALIAGCASSEKDSGTNRPQPQPSHSKPSNSHSQPAPVQTKVVTESLLRVTTNAPRDAVLGQSYTSEVNVTSVSDTGNVVIATQLPNGAQYLRSEPAAQVNGNSISWQFAKMKKNESKKLKVWLKPTREGQYGLCFTASALPLYCVATEVGKPALTIKKTGPATADLGSNVSYNIVVKNTGTAVARNVVVTDNVPQGLVHAGGKQTLTFNVGDMQPGASKTIPVNFKAASRGRVCNVATVRSETISPLNAQACTVIKKKDLTLTVNCPKEKFVGERGNTQIGVNNPGDVPLTGVVLTATYSPAVSVVSADNNPQKSPNRLVWNIGTLPSKSNRTYNITLVGKQEGMHCVDVTITTKEGLRKTSKCCTKWIGQPKLQITKTGPATAKLGERFSYTVTVKSVGTGVAKNVVMTDNIPNGLKGVSGQTVRQVLGDMAPGTSKTVQVPVTGANAGRFCNTANAQANNAQRVNAQACTKIQKQSASVSVTCPKESFLGKRARSVVNVVNTGDVALTNVVISANWDSSKLKVMSADGAQLAGSSATWRVAKVNPGQKLNYGVVAISKFPGKHCVNLTITSAEGIKETATCCTNWRGFPALLLEVIDTVDPLLINEETDYVIEVTNQGTAPDHDVQIIVIFPNETNPIKAQGDTRGTISGKRVTFAKFPKLDPKAKIKYVIRAKAASQGDSRLRVEMTSELLKVPVKEEESTQVY